MEHEIHETVHIEVLCDVLPHELELANLRQVGDVLLAPGDEIVHRNDFVSFGEKTFGKMRTQETRSTRHKTPHEPYCGPS